MSAQYQSPYETGAQFLDCEFKKSGYNNAYYSLKPTCNVNVPSCDNRSYSAYALNSAYQGYYDNCFLGQPEPSQCDLKYVNAPPKVTMACWDKCCKDGCDLDCHTACVVGSQTVANNSWELR